MSNIDLSSKKLWNESFDEQIKFQAYNTAPVEAIVRNVSYYLRDNFFNKDLSELNFLEMGCGAGSNIKWLAQKGIKVSGIDISEKALELCKQNFKYSKLHDKIVHLIESNVNQVPLKSESFDGVIEACVFQHLNKVDRIKSFKEAYRLLKPKGVFVGYMLEVGHTTYQTLKNEELHEDPGTLMLNSSSHGIEKINIENIGLTHFYSKDEIYDLLSDFSIINPLITTYELPEFESKKRGYDTYIHSMFTIYAIK